MSKNIVAILVLAIFSYTLTAQSIRQNTSNTNAWFAYMGSHKIADKWSLHLEFQYRTSEGLSKTLQLLPRVGLNYHISSQAFVTAGYAFIQTYPYGAFGSKIDFPENRIWQQLQLKNQVGSFEWISRFRLEQRFVQSPVTVVGTFGTDNILGNAVFTNRFRLLNRFSIPFKGKTIVNHSFYATIFDELMINFGENVKTNIFDQNRIFIGIGYKFPQLGRLEVGFLEQTIIRSDGIKVENNHTFSISLMNNLDFMKKKEVVGSK
jgi:Protein of unknown function (DUF2490)